MARKITLELYSFDELSEDAKQKAIEWYRGFTEYEWGYDNIKSLQAFASWFHVTIKDYSLGGSDNRNNAVRYELTYCEDMESMSGVRLWKYLNNNEMIPAKSCPFTGYHFDDVLLDPIRKFMARPSHGVTWADLVRECIESFVSAYVADVDYTFSDEAIAEDIRMNEYEFTADGTKH